MVRQGDLGKGAGDDGETLETICSAEQVRCTCSAFSPSGPDVDLICSGCKLIIILSSMS